MRFRLAGVGAAILAFGLSLFFMAQERAAETPGDSGGLGRAVAKEVTPEIESSKPIEIANAIEGRPSPNTDTSLERAPIGSKELGRNDSKEPLIPEVIHIDIDIDPRRGGWQSNEPLVPKVLHVEVGQSGRGDRFTNEPLVPHVIHVNVDHLLAPGEEVSKEAIVPPVIHLE